MTYKKFAALMICILLTVSMVSCKRESDDAELPETTNAATDKITDIFVSDNEPTSFVLDDENKTEEVSKIVSDLSVTAVSLKNLSEYTEAEIIEAYKNAAIKSHSSVTSQHSVEITKISINGEELGGAFDFVKNIISKFISNNSDDTQGITGGYKNLSEADVSVAKIYSVGKNTAVELTMRNQTDGAKADVHGGSVGHAIDVVGDIGTVTSELTELGLPIEISSETTTIHYSNPTVRVMIDENGKIICGTWRYTVEIRLKNYKAFGADVESSSIVMDNVITVNGGFTK